MLCILVVKIFGLRAKAKNFTLEEMAEGVNFAHKHGVKVYVTANILAHNADLEPVKAYFNDLKKVNPDALIIADPAIFTIAKEILPEMELHIVHRQTILITVLTISGGTLAQKELCQPENFRLKK